MTDPESHGKTLIGRRGGIPVYAEDVDAVPVDVLEDLADELNGIGDDRETRGMDDRAEAYWNSAVMVRDVLDTDDWR